MVNYHQNQIHPDLNQNNSRILNTLAGKRIQILIQVGFADELEKEIVHINSILNRIQLCQYNVV